MQNLIIAFRCVVPVFLIICAGALIRHSRKVPEEVFPHLSTIAFHFLLPCTLFYSIYTTDLNTAFDPRLLTYLVVFLLVWYCLGFLISTALVPDHRMRGAYIQTFYRSNIAIIGVSMAASMMGDPGVASISMAIAILVPLYNTLAVITLEVCRGRKIQLKPTLIGIAKNPLILGCVLGVLALLTQVQLPSPVLKAVNQIGTAGSVLTLIALGASFQFSGLRKNLHKVILANLLRLVIAPLVEVGLAVLLGFRGNDLGVILLCAASSLATTSYPMALARDSDHELTGQIVVTTSFFCCFTLFVWIFLLRQFGLL